MHLHLMKKQNSWRWEAASSLDAFHVDGSCPCADPEMLLF